MADILDGVTIDRGRTVNSCGHPAPPARWYAIAAARRARTPATSVLNSIVPRLSSIGLHAASHAAARLASAASSSVLPMIASAAAGTSMTVGPTAPSATRAFLTTPFGPSVRHTPALTTAISISVRGMKRRYASPDFGAGFGNRIASMTSPFLSDVLPGPVTTSSTAIVRRPLGPTTAAFAPAAIIAGTLSAAGDALHRLPTTVHRP